MWMRRVRQVVKKLRRILVAVEYRFAPVDSIQDLVDCAGIFEAEFFGTGTGTEFPPESAGGD